MNSCATGFGPAGTITPCHHDPYDNFLCQVVGSKYIRLYHPSNSPHLYPFTEGKMTNTSQVDVMDPDYAKFPNIAKAEYTECVLNAGEMLYIPPRHWHYVQSLSISFRWVFSRYIYLLSASEVLACIVSACPNLSLMSLLRTSLLVSLSGGTLDSR